MPLSDDSWINGNQSSTNFGEGTALSVHNYGPKQALIRFESSAIAGKTVSQATLRVYLRTIGAAGQLSVFPILLPWSEEDVTWSRQPATEYAPASTVALATSMAGGIVSIDVTEVVQRWSTGQIADWGFLLSSTNPIKATFDSKERSGGTPATLTVSTVDAVQDLSRAKVLDLSKPEGCVIGEPGLYVLDRNWAVSGGEESYAQVACHAYIDEYVTHVVRVAANGVTLDFRGYEISGPGYLSGVMLSITAQNVTVRNGTVTGGDIWDGQGISVSGGPEGASLENMVIGNGVNLGSRTSIRFSRIYGPVRVYENSVVEASDIRGNLELRGDISEIRTSRIYGGGSTFYSAAVHIYGARNKVLGNSIRCDACRSGIYVEGSGNRIATNTLEDLGGYSDTAILVSAGANQIDSNTIMPGSFSSCVVFTMPGSYFGGNRCPATAPVVGAADQVNWGGNVTY